MRYSAPTFTHCPMCSPGIVSIAPRSRGGVRAVFLMPAITSLVASVFVDDVADHVERRTLSGGAPRHALPYGSP